MDDVSNVTYKVEYTDDAGNEHWILDNARKVIHYKTEKAAQEGIEANRKRFIQCQEFYLKHPGADIMW